jgi:alkylated DNA repair dioxygenase AlkB
MARSDERHRKFLEEVEQFLREIQEVPMPPATSDQVRFAHQDLLYSIRDLARREQLPHDQLQYLATKIRDYLDLFARRGALSWEQVEYRALVDLRHPSMEKQAVKVRVLLEAMTEPVAVPMDGAKHLATRMIFRELDGSDRIESITTVNTPLIHRVETLKDECHVYDVLATVLLIPMGRGERFNLLVHDMIRSETPLQMVQATHAETMEAKATLLELERSGRSIFDYIFTTVIQGLHIQGLEDATELRDSLEAVIVQAFSDWWVSNASGKLHTLVIGAPAVGKKLLVDAARILNPVFHEAHPSKVTAAGVCSTAVLLDGVWRSKPGYLPLSHRGVFAIQDFHTVKNAERERLLGLFNMVMEDGRVIDSTAARQTHPALTSIHLNTNKRTDLFPESQLRGETIVAKRLDDIRIPMTILSRFDFIIDIPRDAQRQINVALAMYGRQETNVGPHPGGRTLAEWARKLQVLVAYLRTAHAQITFPPEITTVMQQKHEELSQVNEKFLDQLLWLSDIQARLTNSVFKYAAAYARLSNRQSPTSEDIDRVFRLIWRKFEFLATLARHLYVPKSWEVPRHIDLEEWLQARFAGRQVRTKDILAAYQDEFGLAPVRRTVERHLPMVAHPGERQGLWEFPASAPREEANFQQHCAVRTLKSNSSHVFDPVADARHTDYERIPLRDADIRYYPCFFAQEIAERYFQMLLAETAWEQRTLVVFGKQHLEPRLTAWYGDEGASFSYSGTTRHPNPWTQLLREIKQCVEHAAGVCYNSVLINQYRNGNDSVSWHSDDESSLGHNPSIASVSLGAVRSFHLRHRQDKQFRHTLDLAHGSLLVMQGPTQHYWHHQVPKIRRAVGPRINLTFRIIVDRAPVEA